MCDRASRIENLQTLIRQTSDRSKEILVSSQLKQIANEKGQQRHEFKIGTEGTPLRVKLGKEKVQIKFPTLKPLKFKLLNKIPNTYDILLQIVNEL